MATAAVVLAAAGAITAVAYGRSSGAGIPAFIEQTSEGGVEIPATVDGLSMMTGAAEQSVVAAMQNADAKIPDLSNALYTGYAKSGTAGEFGTLVLVPLSESSGMLQEYDQDGAAQALKALGFTSSSTYSDVEVVNTDVPGGAMSCAVTVAGEISFRTCAWVDSQEAGIFAANTTLSDAQVAAYAQAIWAASEAG